MKILLINNGKGWSGGQEHLKDLAVELRNNGVEVHFLVREDTVNETRFAELGFKVHLMPYKYGWNSAGAFLKLVATMRREKFNIVSINREHDLALTVLAYRFAFPFGSSGRLMMSYHAATIRNQFLIGSVDAVVCISEHVRDKLLLGNPEVAAKTDILYYGIVLSSPPEASKYAAERPRRLLEGVRFPLIGMVGEFWKNQEELIEIIPILKEQYPMIKVALVGPKPGGYALERIMELIRRLGVEENVILTGLIPRQKIPELFYDLDLSVTTHRNEGFGIVHLESLAAGTPVVAYNEGGFVDIFKGEQVGILVDGGPGDFAAAVLDLLNDNEKRYAMGEAGYRLVKQKYSVQAMGETYLGFYRKLLNA